MKEKEIFMEKHKNSLNLIVVLGLLFVAAVSGAYLLQHVTVIEDVIEDDENMKSIEERLIEDDENMKSIEERLTEDGWRLITTSWCHNCKEQKKILNMDEISSLECDISQENANKCDAMEIQVVPTWINIKTNESIIGYQSIEDLEELVR